MDLAGSKPTLLEILMETNKAAIGALLFIVLVIGANFVMYAIARGAAKSNQKSFLETISKMEELEKGKEEDADPPR